MNVHAPSTWAIFGALVVVLLSIDLLAHRGDHQSSRNAAFIWSGVWIALAIAFGIFIRITSGPERSSEYFAAYTLEKSLSLDNLFVFLVVFQRLKIPQEEQRRVLSWGIFGALVMRGLFIAAGSALLHRWHFIVYGLGALLVLTGIKLARSKDDDDDTRVLDFLTKKLPVTKELHGHHFFAREAGKLLATPMFLALVTVELSDVMFAVDSVPAAFAVSEHAFVIYASNVFAILGLRALFVALSQSLKKSRELEIALSGVLCFAGAKMLVSHWVHVPAGLSVAVIVGTIGAGFGLRVLRKRRERREAAH